MTHMKSTNDTAELARRIALALDEAELTPAQVAAACGVSPQAVNGWKKTGRIGKEQLPKLAELTGRPLSWWLGAEETESKSLSPEAAATERLVRAVRGRSAAEIERIADALEVLLRAGKERRAESGSIEIDTGDDVRGQPVKRRRNV